MKKIGLLFICGIFSMGMNAQTTKQLEQDIVRLSVELANMEDSLATLQKKTAAYSKRKDLRLSKAAPYEWLKRYQSVKELYADSNNVKRKQEALWPIVEMYRAYEKGCSKQEFDAIFARLKRVSLPDSCSAELKDDYKLVKLYFEDYDYTMSELARVFDVVDKAKTAGDALLNQLKKDDETYYIDRIPYVRMQLEKFVGSSRPSGIIEENKDKGSKNSSSEGSKKSPREKQREELAKAWPKAGFLSK